MSTVVHNIGKSWLILAPVVILVAVVVTVYLTQNLTPNKSQAATYQYMRQAVMTLDNRSFYRDCLITTTSDPDPSFCTPWADPTSSSTIRGVGNESYGAYG